MVAQGITELKKIPETVQGLITNRIDSLAPTAQLVLKVASVIGRTFLFECLQEVRALSSPFMAKFLVSLPIVLWFLLFFCPFLFVFILLRIPHTRPPAPFTAPLNAAAAGIPC